VRTWSPELPSVSGDVQDERQAKECSSQVRRESRFRSGGGIVFVVAEFGGRSVKRRGEVGRIHSFAPYL
jgi:hypothetical protein